MDALLLALIGAIGVVAVLAGIRSSGGLSPDRPGASFAGGVVVGESVRRSDEPDKAMQRYLRKRSPEGQQISFYSRYQSALEHMESMPRHATGRKAGDDVTATALPGTWTQLGPGNIGGRTRALVIAPGDGNTIYAAGVAGGIWKTTNGGASWSPLNDFLPNLAVNSLAIDPNNANVLYAGTGEGFFNVDAVRGAGIFKSTNAGATWNPVGGTDSNFEFHYVNDIVVSKGNSQHVFAATGEGVFRSLDGGASWSEVTGIDTFSTGCFDLAIRTDILPTDTVFASCGNSAAGIYRSTDAGAAGGTWTQVHTEPAMGRTSLAIAPSAQGTIYALSASAEEISSFYQGLHKVLRSTNNGDTWTTQAEVTTPATMVNALLSNPRELFRSNCGQGTTGFFNQGWYDNVIAVDPVDANIVYAGGIDLFRSNDGGVAWGHISRWDRAPLVHADQHVIAFHPGYNGTSNKTMLVGNDGGIYKTTDARAASNTNICSPYVTTGISVPWQSLNNGYGVTQFYDGTAFPNTTDYFGGTQDNGTIRSSDGAGANAWFEEVGGDGGYVAVNPTNTQVLYAEAQNFFFMRSDNGGVTWQLKDDLPRANNCVFPTGECMPFITPFSLDPTNGSRVFTGGWYAYRTDNGGNTWTQVGDLLPGCCSTSAIASSPHDSDLLLVGMEDGWIARLTDATTADASTPWETASQPWGGYLSSIAFDPINPLVAYATYSTFSAVEEHVWKSEDAGETWVPIDGSGIGKLPDIPVHSIVVDPVNTQTLYIGTDLGIFVTTDGGANWAVENTGFANVVTEKLEIRGTGVNARLFAFTHGRGAWRTPLGAVATVPGAPTGVAATAGNAQVDVSWTAPAANGGSPITNYIVTPYVGVTAQTPTEVGNVTATTITGLTNGTAYRFTVKAKNAIGTGPESVLSNEVTPTLPPAPDTVISSGPSGTTALNVARFVFSSVPGGATFECRRNGGAWSACSSPRNETVIPGPFTFEVRAVGAGGADATPALRSLRVMRPFLFDSDLNGKHEIAVWRPASGGWYRPAQATAFFGAAGDVPMPGQWDADPAADFAVWRPSTGTWFRQGQANVSLGVSTDIPVPVDWNGDGQLEPTVYRNGAWFRLGLPTLFFGGAGDIPLPGQWDADPEPDLAVFRPSTGGWFRQGQATTFFGLAGDIPVPADWTGDGQLDIGLWRPVSGGWYRPGQPTTYFGASGDIPVLGDWDADPTPDIAVWRPASGGWYRLGQATTYFGAPTDVP